MKSPNIQAHFESIISLPAGERLAALDRLALGPADKAELAELLASHDQAASFLAHPTADLPTSDRITEAAGQHIGPYKLLQLIGEGGFGSVFMAEQEAPVRRRVALKIIKLGMDTRQVVARFEQERQALAIMDHPHIAKVFDAGATQTGRPFFVMEYVKGRPITEYADTERLTLKARLDLFLQVCRAVQHAHMKGVIHRDLKPRNVLVGTVDGRPAAKVIDFGIAKATAQRMTEKTLFTEHHALIGTPEYMSPEQAEGSIDIDTRTDVYSLGVLLYELLTGTTPIDSTRLRSAAFNEMVRLIREIEPPSPSVRVTAMVPLPEGGGRGEGSPSRPSQREGLGVGSPLRPRTSLTGTPGSDESKALSRQIKGELDWIVMKCLDKDRARRYATPDALAEDLQRHLSGEPVVAAPPSRGYLVQKFVKRHKGPLLTGTAVLGVLILGIAGTTWQWSVARQQRDLVEQQAKLARWVLQSTLGEDAKDLVSQMQSGIRETLDYPFAVPPDDAADILMLGAAARTSRDSLKETIRSLEDEIKRARLAEVNTAIGQWEILSEADLSKSDVMTWPEALVVRRELLGDGHPDVLEATWLVAMQSWNESTDPSSGLKPLVEQIEFFHGKGHSPNAKVVKVFLETVERLCYAARFDEAMTLIAEVAGWLSLSPGGTNARLIPVSHDTCQFGDGLASNLYRGSERLCLGDPRMVETMQQVTSESLRAHFIAECRKYVAGYLADAPSDVISNINTWRCRWVLAPSSLLIACGENTHDAYLAKGFAMFRLGNWQEACESLRTAVLLESATTAGAQPAMQAILAITHFKLGHVEEAKAALIALRELTTKDEWKADATTLALLKEAAALIEGKEAEQGGVVK